MDIIALDKGKFRCHQDTQSAAMVGTEMGRRKSFRISCLIEKDILQVGFTRKQGSNKEYLEN